MAVNKTKKSAIKDLETNNTKEALAAKLYDQTEHVKENYISIDRLEKELKDVQGGLKNSLSDTRAATKDGVLARSKLHNMRHAINALLSLRERERAPGKPYIEGYSANAEYSDEGVINLSPHQIVKALEGLLNTLK